MGLVPQYECFDSCSSAWHFYIATSLRNRIIDGSDQPNPKIGSAREILT